MPILDIPFVSEEKKICFISKDCEIGNSWSCLQKTFEKIMEFYFKAKIGDYLIFEVKIRIVHETKA